MAIEIVRQYDEQAIEDMAHWVAAQNFSRVLDLGGHEYPLRCATHVMDLKPWTDAGFKGRGPLPVRHRPETWLVHDMCVTPWPYQFGFFDFVWCSQTIEDIRDPIAVCNEMQRIGAAGFISTVHRHYESTIVQHDGVVGYHHHRWLIEADEEKSELRFTFKSPILHAQPGFRPSANGPVKPWLYNIKWNGGFMACEIVNFGHLEQEADLRAYQERWRAGETL